MSRLKPGTFQSNRTCRQQLTYHNRQRGIQIITIKLKWLVPKQNMNLNNHGLREEVIRI